MKLVSIAWILVVILLYTGRSLWAQQKDARRLAAEVCASCHGPTGISVSPAYPRLAGQRPEYLAVQLKAFRDRSRGDPMAQAFMWGMASQLSDDTIAGLAAYYAAQKPLKATAADTKLVREGQIIFAQGIPIANVAPCQTCHGQQAEGNAAIPRLAGQHAEYMVKQLVLFKSELRAGASAPIMGMVAAMRFVRSGRYDARAAIGLTVGGIPGVLMAVWLVKSLPLDVVRWGVIAVVLYTALTLIRSAYDDRRVHAAARAGRPASL